MDDTLKDLQGAKISTVGERFERENVIRIDRSKSVLSFGVKFLDRALEGISRKDLILVGSPTGCGKSELVAHIAAHNAYRGRRVLFFALEAEECEIESRIKYKVAVEHFLRAGGHQNEAVNRLSYRKYYYGRLAPEFDLYIKAAERQLLERLKTLTTIYREREFMVDDLQRYLLMLKDRTDLVVIDHLNYFDFDEKNDKQNENKAVTDIVKKIRDLALISGLPIILVAHIKKQDKRFKSLIPEIEDFHGTSNISKIATKAILLAPDPGLPDNPKRIATYFRVAKFRVDSSSTRYIARCEFNTLRNRYEDDFDLGHLVDQGKTFQAIENQELLPEWAKGPAQ